MPSEREPTGHFAIRLLDEASSDSDSEVRGELLLGLEDSPEGRKSGAGHGEHPARGNGSSSIIAVEGGLSANVLDEGFHDEEPIRAGAPGHQATAPGSIFEGSGSGPSGRTGDGNEDEGKTSRGGKKKQKEEAERQRQEEEQKRRQAAEEERLQELKQQEERRIQEQKELEEKEKEAYRLVQISEPDATAYRQRQAAVLQEYNTSLKAFCEDASMKDARRGIKKFITLSVQQISATQEQVNKKSNSLLHFLSEQHDLQRKFSLVTLASKMLSQCEVQITRLHSFAFPLGEVSVSIGPKGSKDVKYFRTMRFRVETTEASSVSVENEEEYVGRLQGYIRLYAAILQNDSPAKDFGMSEAWSYVALLLNGIPSSRYSASALMRSCQSQVFKMYTRFRRQFEKLLAYVTAYFLQDLKDTNDPDANAVAARLESYIQSKVFLQPPEGRSMPVRDESSYSRA
eukprot:jgi/Picre1/30882/NNA_006241.t1